MLHVKLAIFLAFIGLALAAVSIPAAQPTSDEELAAVSEALFQQDTNLMSLIRINMQGRTLSGNTDDVAPLPLLQLHEHVLTYPSIAKLRALFDKYKADTNFDEVMTPAIRKQQEELLDVVMATPVMKTAMRFLQSKGIVTGDARSQRDLLQTIWFTLYSRGNRKLSSSGFEHVFLSEVKNGGVIGLHNWVYFAEEEKAGILDYKGYTKRVDLGNKAAIVATRFSLNGLMKPINSLFIGTTPELEMALYTICFKLREGAGCPLSMGGARFSLKTFNWTWDGKSLIGSAYPEI